MKTLFNVRRIHRTAIAAVLLVAFSLGFSAGSAQARPKNACQDYLHMMEVTKGLGDRALALYSFYKEIGDDQTAAGYQQEFRIWSIIGPKGSTHQVADARHGARPRREKPVSAAADPTGEYHLSSDESD
jgi:hypothetical protein